MRRVLGLFLMAGLVCGLLARAEPVSAAPDARSWGCFALGGYPLFLDREATSAEVDAWVKRFNDGTPRDRLPAELANSDEWLGVVVSGLYQQALDREPDAAGLAFWTGELRRGALVNAVASRIYGSAEFYARAGGTSASFVRDLYVRILHREPDAGGLSYWQGQVTRLGRGRVASLFFASAESRVDRVTGLYRQVLGRAPDAGGRRYWVDQLRSVNDVRLAVLLASSAEFFQRAQATCATRRITDGNQSSESPDISGDGRFVVYSSLSTDLVPHDDNSVRDVFLWDRDTGVTTRVTDGADGPSASPAISDDGAHVAFVSDASNLVVGDSNATADVFTWHRTTGVITRVGTT